MRFVSTICTLIYNDCLIVLKLWQYINQYKVNKLYTSNYSVVKDLGAHVNSMGKLFLTCGCFANCISRNCLELLKK